MKKHIALLMITAFSCALMNFSTANAQSNRIETRKFINRTNVILMKAKEAVTAGKFYSGDLVKAVYHQKFAKELFITKKYNSAVHHSNRARILAFEAMKANNTEVTADLKLLLAEKELIKDLPNYKTLDDEIKIPAGTDDKSVLTEKEEDISEDK